MPGFKKVQKGEITVFLSLILILLLSLLAALLESASVRMARSERQIQLTYGLESVFAEYHKELWKQYHIFAIDEGYESNHYSYDSILSRLSYYGASHTDNQVAEAKRLTDDKGMEFYRLAVAYELGKYGLENGSSDGGKEWSEQTQEGNGYLKQEEDLRTEISSQLQEAEESLPMEDNPMGIFDQISGSGILALLDTGERTVSEEVKDAEKLPSHRKLQKGNSSFQEEGTGGVIGKGLFQNYLMNHFSYFTKEGEESGCEIEYLLVGGESDKENLEKTLNRILLLRLPVNYAYLMKSTAKKAEAEALAASICSVLTVPAVTSLVKQGILLAWAYGESVVDLQVLLDGKKVPLLKDDESWQLQLSSVVSLGKEKIQDAEKETEKGMAYEDYLRALLLITGKETLCMRGLDVMEENLSLPMDCCITQMRVAGTCVIRNGKKHVLEAEFHYE